MLSESKSKIKAVITEIVSSMVRSDSERDYRNEAFDALAKESEVSVKMLKKLAKMAYSSSTTKVEDEISDLEEVSKLYEEIFA